MNSRRRSRSWKKLTVPYAAMVRHGDWNGRSAHPRPVFNHVKRDIRVAVQPVLRILHILRQ